MSIMWMPYDLVSGDRTSENVSPMKDLTLNEIEQTRLHVLNAGWEHQLPVAQAAELLEIWPGTPILHKPLFS